MDSKASPVQYESFKDSQERTDPVEFEPKIMPGSGVTSSDLLEPNGIPVEYVEYASTNVRIDPEQYDSELEFELAVVASDQKRELNLVSDPIFEGDPSILPMEIFADEEFWSKPASSLD